MRRMLSCSLITLGLLASCGSDGDTQSTSVTTAPADSTTVAPPAPTEPPTSDAPATDPPATDPPADDAATFMREVVEVLAADDMEGRDNQTPGGERAREYLLGVLADLTEPFFEAEGDEGYTHEFAQGVNLLGVIPGGDLADELVIVGAHYDHVGGNCKGTSLTDQICNGAIDNATGVAAALSIAGTLAAAPDAPRRTVVIALWDAEEDGLLGAQAFLTAELVPASSIVTYVNFDILGTNISPALTGSTVVVGAETGGALLVAATQRAVEASRLDTVLLSLLFGQGRSDHAPFVNAEVPAVFFTDATPPCYHDAGDDVDIVDFPKLEEQFAAALALTGDLAGTDDPPTFTADSPLASYDDAVSLLALVSQAEPDFVRFGAADQAAAAQYLVDLQAIVDAGAGAFDDAAMGTMLGGAVQIVNAWSTGTCEAFFG